MKFDSIQDTINNIVERNSGKTAVEFGDKSYSYAQINHDSDNIAGILNSIQNIGENILVFAEKRPFLIEAILGIIKAGKVFIPVNERIPNNRLKVIIEETKSNWILSEAQYLDRLDQIAASRSGKINVVIETPITIDSHEYVHLNVYCKEDFLFYEAEKPSIFNDSCYIYFTSGSTGKPKGVVGRHTSLKHFINWEIEQFGVDESFRVSQLITPTFDPFLRDIFVPLCSGGTICIPEDEDMVMNPRKLVNWIDENDITLIHMVPTLFKAMVNELQDSKHFYNLKYILLAGEPLRGKDLDKFYRLFGSRIQLVNMYGPTETTLAKAYYMIDPTDTSKINIPIGKPISDTELLVLDDQLKPCPQGNTGEIYIRTQYMSSGYLNDKALTDSVFIKNPFSENTTDIIYKTGDLGRILPDGNIECLGRLDNQIKIRGMRIELTEIEAELLKIGSVREAVVIVHENDDGDKALCAFLTGDTKLDKIAVRELLLKELPDYMVPSHFVLMDKIPLLPNGKTDRKSLQKFELDTDAGINLVKPRNNVEEKLLSIWKEVLHIRNAGVTDNFFLSGGHSLKAAFLVLRLQKEFNADISVKEIFTNPTIEALAGFINRTGKYNYTPIPRAPEAEYYPVSSAQKRMFLINRIDDPGTVYNLTEALLIEGCVNKELLNSALRTIVTRHEALRTSFEHIEGEIVQRIHKDVQFKMEYFEEDKPSEGIRDMDERINDMMKDFVRPFDLNSVPLFRVRLVKISEDKYILFRDMHHIISDGISEEILKAELAALISGKQPGEVNTQYKDFTLWHNGLQQSEAVKLQEEFWLDALSGEIPVLGMPTDYSRPLLQSFEGDRVRVVFDRQFREKLSRLAAENGVTLYMLLLAAFNVLLSKYTGQEDILVGTPSAGRGHNDLENVIGNFVNTVVMRNRADSSKTFREFLEAVRDNSIKAFANQDYQFENLVEKLNISRDISRNPLFDVMFAMQNMHFEDMSIEGIKVTKLEYDSKTSKFDITMTFFDEEDGMELHLDYCTGLFKKETIERFEKHFENILMRVVDNINIRLSDIDMLSGEEKDQLKNVFNNTLAEYPKDKTIQMLFEEQVEKSPENTAVIFEGDRLTYRELNIKCNQLARLLRENGVGRDSIVGIVAERSFEMIIGIMGILKAGGAYLPISPDYPRERVKYILENSGSTLLLQSTTGRVQLPESDKAIDGKTIKVIDITDKTIYNGDGSDLEHINTSRDLAYVIYTSGSTGKPKGVMIEHYSVINRLNWMQKQYPVSSGDVILQKTTYTFDVSVWELFWWSFQGGAVYMLTPGGEKDPGMIAEAVRENGITTMHFVPSMLNAFLEFIELQKNISGLKSLRQVFASGEALTLQQVERFNRLLNAPLGTTLHNLYGPTEATVDVSYFDCSTGEILNTIPIGKPIDNIRLYILDKNNLLQPVGVAGELHIAGDGLARGYINRPELTAERFVPDPFISGERMYKTGDLARWLPDGNIEYLGRSDHQVKVRGFRIELQEIEKCILECNGVSNSLCVVKEDGYGNRYLAAYYIAENEIPISEMRSHLFRYLPDYMVPQCYTFLKEFPMTPNGKIDRKALPECNTDTGVKSNYQAPGNVIEERLVKIWNEVLHVNNTGVKDNFFLAGGHSLSAVSLALKLQKEFGTEITVKDIFRNPTVEALAVLAGKSERADYSQIPAAPEMEYYPVSSAQKRTFLVNLLEDTGTGYNMPEALLLEGQPDREAIEKAFGTIVARHEALRTSFELMSEEIIQRVHKDIKFTLEYMESDSRQKDMGDTDALVNELMSDFIRPFDLGLAPLFRVRLVKVAEDKYVLLRDMHHIVSDGISEEILKEEFIKLYNGKPLPDLKAQYKDFALWQKNIQQSENVKRQEKYWLEAFSGEIPVLKMPTDFIRPPKQSFEGDRFWFEPENRLVQALRRTAAENGVTLYMFLLAAFNVLLSRYTGQEDILVGSPVAGREHTDMENIIGAFINTIVMRNYPSGNKTFGEFLGEVRENSLKAYENQDCQFESLVDKLNLARDMSRSPLFDIMFTMQNMHSEKFEIDGLKVTELKTERKVSKFDITLNAAEKGDRLEFYLEYCTEIYSRTTIERLAGHFVNLLKQAAGNVDIKLSNMEMLSSEEKEQIICGFNRTSADYDSDKTIHQLFEEQVDKHPEKAALVFGDKKMTYRELDKESNKLARILRKKGVKADSIVGLVLHRSFDLLVGIMGVLKAGGAYLPIDPEYPSERIRYMLDHSGAGILLMQNSMDKSGRGIAVIDPGDESLSCIDGSRVENITVPENLAYVIYTSGSTGKPKGVMIEHRNVVNLIKGITDKIDFSEDKTVLCLTTVSFDIFVLETLLPLAKGNTIVIANEEQQLNPGALCDLIKSNGVDLLQITPSRLQMLLQYVKSIEYLKNIKELIVGGEAFPEMLLESLRELKNTRIYNVYGPTETTVWSTIKDVTGCREINIGRPIANTTAYILDTYNRIQPTGVAGELHLAGDGLSRGYLNMPEMTSERFVRNPFNSGLMYKTGDLARFLPNGEIEFIGRMDSQVKVRGYRIELSEIEKCMLELGCIKNCLCVVKEDTDKNKYLALYYISDAEIPVPEIRTHLSRYLPDYMVPQNYTFLEKFPMTPNGKIDRKELPEPGRIQQKPESEYTAAMTDTEKAVAAVWREILKLDSISVNDNFFEVGGNSLKLVLMLNSLESLFPGRVGVADIFANPTISMLARFISIDIKASVGESILPLEFPEEYLVDIDENEESEDTVFEYVISNEFYESLMALNENGFETEAILFSFYSYLLAEVTGQDKVAVQKPVDRKNAVQLIVDLSEVESIVSLLEEVSSSLKMSGSTGSYTLGASIAGKAAKEHKHVIAAFSCIEEVNIRDFGVCHILLKAVINDGSINLEFQYDSTRIKYSKAAELFKLFVKTADVTINKIINT